MKPYIHAKNSARIFGGKPEDYIKIHDRMDSTKSAEPTVKHRCIFHSAFGIYIIEEIFGNTIINSDNIEVSVRDVAEQHVLEDLGTIPTLSDWLKDMPIKDWMGKPKSITTKIELFEIKKDTHAID